MISNTLANMVYLAPMAILGVTILILLLLLVLNKKSQFCFYVTVSCLALTLMTSLWLEYKILDLSKPLTMNNKSLSVNSNNNNIETIQENSDDSLLVTGNSAANLEAAAETADASPFDWQAKSVTTFFSFDGYGLLYTSLILLIAIVATTLTNSESKLRVPHYYNSFYIMIVFAALGGVVLAYASHLFALFIGIELLSIALIGLVGFHADRENSLEAAIKYMILSSVASAFLLLGIAFYYAATGELTFIGLSVQLSIIAYPSLLLLIGVCLILVGVGFKLSLVPFQLWSPDVYQGAPTTVSLLLSTVSRLAVFCVMARLFLLAPIVTNEMIRIILIIIAFLSILWGSLFALKQRDVKRLLAYSSITQFGYLLVALISVQYQVLALETIGICLIGYALANVCILGVIHLETIAAGHNDIDLSGLFWRRPMLALAASIGFLSLAGVPLTVGFIGRFTLILLGVTAELWWLIGAIIIGSTIGLYYYLRLAINVYIKPAIPVDAPFKRPMRLRQRIGINEFFIICCAIVILLCGIAPQFVFDLVTVARYLVP